MRIQIFATYLAWELNQRATATNKRRGQANATNADPELIGSLYERSCANFAIAAGDLGGVGNNKELPSSRDDPNGVTDSGEPQWGVVLAYRQAEASIWRQYAKWTVSALYNKSLMSDRALVSARSSQDM